ncbi:MAG: hypothetical protein PHP92_05720 [Candidatus Nanoarchaeia archaeon]|nr:hypothetical protein [Candidatus Nanoarchaeia archaeon]
MKEQITDKMVKTQFEIFIEYIGGQVSDNEAYKDQAGKWRIEKRYNGYWTIVKILKDGGITSPFEKGLKRKDMFNALYFYNTVHWLTVESKQVKGS